VCLRTMHPKRRSGRIAKELDIVLLGTDTTGKVFSEPTKTVVLSRHGAGIVSRYRFTPDEVLILRLPDSSKEAEVRLVGQIGGEPGRYIHGVAFVDPDPHFWPMEFPPPESSESFESGSQPLMLECSLCKERQTVEPHEIEEDVYSVNGNILRYCESCGTATPWKKAVGEALPASGVAASKAPMKAPVPSPVPRECTELPLRAASPIAALIQPRTASHLAASGPAPSRYSGASALAEFSSFGEEPASQDVASATAVLQPPEVAAASPREDADISSVNPEAVPEPLLDANGKRINRRKHMRIRVNFSARVRQAGHSDEIVECENVSKGGLCFHSLQKYALNSLMEIAAPYSPGEAALFVRAKIKRIEALSGGLVFRYGLEYMKSPDPSA
jgi:PilZ domain